MIIEVWQFWCIVALLLFVLEIFTSGFGVFCFAVGCIGGAITSGLNFGLNVQIFVFCITSMISFVTIRPVLLKYFSRKTVCLTNTDALIGRTAIVVEIIDNKKNKGRVKIDGDIWKAISFDDSIIEVNEKVVIIQIDSIVLTVKK